VSWPEEAEPGHFLHRRPRIVDIPSRIPGTCLSTSAFIRPIHPRQKVAGRWQFLCHPTWGTGARDGGHPVSEATTSSSVSRPSSHPVAPPPPPPPQCWALLAASGWPRRWEGGGRSPSPVDREGRWWGQEVVFTGGRQPTIPAQRSLSGWRPCWHFGAIPPTLPPCCCPVTLQQRLSGVTWAQPCPVRGPIPSRVR